MQITVYYVQKSSGQIRKIGTGEKYEIYPGRDLTSNPSHTSIRSVTDKAATRKSSAFTITDVINPSELFVT